VSGPDQAVSAESCFETLHQLAVRGSLPELEGGDSALLDAGLVTSTPVGFMLTAAGHTAHDSLLARERQTLDVERLAQIYERFLAVNPSLKALIAAWPVAEDDAIQAQFERRETVERVGPALRRTAELLPRFERYQDRLGAALARVEHGEGEYVAGVAVDSVHNVWMHVHEDYLQTLDRSREQEGSY
jgi:uncharacterized protein (DUF1778 family)